MARAKNVASENKRGVKNFISNEENFANVNSDAIFLGLHICFQSVKWVEKCVLTHGRQRKLSASCQKKTYNGQRYIKFNLFCRAIKSTFFPFPIGSTLVKVRQVAMGYRSTQTNSMTRQSQDL